jgi:glutamate dehydrogenase (NAD(P)+)
MERTLRDQLPDHVWENRLTRDAGRCYLEFEATDVDQLARLGIVADALGPFRVVCLWDETAPEEIGGYLIIDNLAMGQPSIGGIRMLPDVTPAAIHNLARGMTLKNAAADLPYGGGKAGIVGSAPVNTPEHATILRGFARLLRRYQALYIPGPDVGTNDADMRTIAVENGLDAAVSKTVDMGGNRIDQLGAAAGGTIIALEALLAEMPRLRVLPQFANLRVPAPEEVTVLIQGFGAVGAHAARHLSVRLPAARVIGISDAQGCLYLESGLPAVELFQRWQAHGLVTRAYFLESLASAFGPRAKYSSQPNDLLREDAFCLIPAAPMAQYLDTVQATQPAVTVEKMGRWRLSVEGANTYSPDPVRQTARARMERAVYRQHGVLIATDYLVNSGGVIFAAQERLIPTPEHLRFPASHLGDPAAVEAWLSRHAAELQALAEKRRIAAEHYREDVIRRNMRELVDALIADPDRLPAEAAEQISVRRITARESGRTAADLMTPIPTIGETGTLREAAATLVAAHSPLVAVVSPTGRLAGVVTEWDITRATAQCTPADQPLGGIMTRQVIAAAADDTILALVSKLEHHDLSAMPVVHGEAVLGMVTTDLLAQRSLLRLLQARPV